MSFVFDLPHEYCQEVVAFSESIIDSSEEIERKSVVEDFFCIDPPVSPTESAEHNNGDDVWENFSVVHEEVSIPLDISPEILEQAAEFAREPIRTEFAEDRPAGTLPVQAPESMTTRQIRDNCLGLIDSIAAFDQLTRDSLYPVRELLVIALYAIGVSTRPQIAQWVVDRGLWPEVVGVTSGKSHFNRQLAHHIISDAKEPKQYRIFHKIASTDSGRGHLLDLTDVGQAFAEQILGYDLRNRSEELLRRLPFCAVKRYFLQRFGAQRDCRELIKQYGFNRFERSSENCKRFTHLNGLELDLTNPVEQWKLAFVTEEQARLGLDILREGLEHYITKRLDHSATFVHLPADYICNFFTASSDGLRCTRALPVGTLFDRETLLNALLPGGEPESAVVAQNVCFEAIPALVGRQFFCLTHSIEPGQYLALSHVPLELPPAMPLLVTEKGYEKVFKFVKNLGRPNQKTKKPSEVKKKRKTAQPKAAPKRKASKSSQPAKRVARDLAVVSHERLCEIQAELEAELMVPVYYEALEHLKTGDIPEVEPLF